MDNYELGDIYYIDRAYEENPNESKLRPAVIVGIDEDKEFIYTLIATTSKGRSNPPKYHDRFKHPILNWRNEGLTEPSW